MRYPYDSLEFRWTKRGLSRISWSMGRISNIAVILASTIFIFAVSGHAAGERYEDPMSRLAGASSQAEADSLSSEIWRIWLTAPDPVAQEVLDAALSRRRARDYLGAILHLERLIKGWPDYAEGWNQRATVHFLTGNYEASLADVAEVLVREPRHFGALSGKAVILFRQGRTALAQIASREALRHHPVLRERAILDISAGIDL